MMLMFVVCGIDSDAVGRVVDAGDEKQLIGNDASAPSDRYLLLGAVIIIELELVLFDRRDLGTAQHALIDELLKLLC